MLAWGVVREGEEVVVGLEVRAFGPLTIVRDGVPAPVGSHLQRVLLALLVIRRGGVVSVAGLVESMWPADPPAAAARNVRFHVHRLRRVLGDTAAIRYQPPGYALVIADAGVDVHQFEALVQRGRAALAGGDGAGAAALLRQADTLCLGPAFQGLEDLAELGVESQRLDELRFAAVEDRIAAELALGEQVALISELSALVATHPLRERFRAQLMTALYRSGRKADALAAYQDGRRILIDELGIEPSEECQRLESAILTDDPSLQWSGRLPAPAVGADGPAAPPGNSPASPGDSPPPVPRQLPLTVPAFTGRGTELQRLDALLPAEGSASPLALVISAVEGTAGVGKTALATHWAHRVRHRFPDGQLFVDLRGYAPGLPLSPAAVLAQFLRALGVPAERIPEEVDEAAGMYRSLMAERSMLVVLDNAVDPAQVRPLLPGSDRCAVVVTSRGPLSGLAAREGAHRLDLDVLSLAESVALLSALLDPDRAYPPEQVAALAELCGRLPLALRIAAANLAAGTDLAGYLTRLRDTDRLSAFALPGDASSSVRAVFDLSYTRLTDPARRMFRLLGLVPGADITADAAAALTRGTPEQARALLASLAAAHLVRSGSGGRYSCHDLLREYAAHRAHTEEGADEQTAALDRLSDYYLAAATAAAEQISSEKSCLQVAGELPAPVAMFPDLAAALAWLDAERANLVATARYAAAAGGQPRVGWLLADVLRPYLHRGMHLTDGLAVAEAGLAAAESVGSRRGQATARFTLAGLRFAQLRCHETIEHASLALTLCRDLGCVDAEGVAHNLLGIACDALGRPAEAADHLQEALDLHERSGSLTGQGLVVLNLGAILCGLGRLREAAVRLAQAAELNRAGGNRSTHAGSLINLGVVHHLLGDLDAAQRYLDQALAICRPIGDRDGEATASCALAEVHRDAGRQREAAQSAGAALQMARAAGSVELEGQSLRVLAELRADAEDARGALADRERALDLVRQTDGRYAQAEALVSLAEAHQRVGALAAAASWTEQALAATREMGYRLLEGRALTTEAATQLATGELEPAMAVAKAALAIHRETGYRLGEARTHVVLWHTHAAAGAVDEGAEHWRAADTLFKDLGVPEPGLRGTGASRYAGAAGARPGVPPGRSPAATTL